MIVPPAFFIGVMSRRATAGHVLAAMGFGVALLVPMVAWYIKSKIDVANGTAERPLSFLIVSMPGFIGTIVFGLIAPYFVGKRPTADKLENLTLFTLTKNNPTETGGEPAPAREDKMPVGAPVVTPAVAPAS